MISSFLSRLIVRSDQQEDHHLPLHQEHQEHTGTTIHQEPITHLEITIRQETTLHLLTPTPMHLTTPILEMIRQPVKICQTMSRKIVFQKNTVPLLFLLLKSSETLWEHWQDRLQEQEHVHQLNHAGQREEGVVVLPE